MEEQANSIESLFLKAKDYVDTSLEIYKLKATQKSSELISGLISWVFMLLIFSLFILLLNIALGLWIGELLGNGYYGFFVLAAFYGILFILFYLFKNKWIKKPVTDAIIKKMNQ